MERHYSYFESYLKGELSDEEITDFTNKLSSCKKFKENYLLYKKTSDFFDYKIKNIRSERNFIKNVNKISNRYFEKENTPQKKNYSHYWKLGALILFLSLFVAYLLRITTSPSYYNFVTYNKIELTLKTNQSKLLIQTESAFNTKAFKEAHSYLTLLLEMYKGNTELELYDGFSLIELNRFSEADSLLKEIANGNSIYKDKATWYLALSKLKQKDYTSCISILKMIPKDSIAKKLLSKLE
ncbi:Protein of unknown function precursor, putative sensor of anti-sigma and ECF sigma factor [Tenacibaculum maritimum]|uniref:hypothetical protein n=1 Tax=Tenacibaculum maritimum TaxID=107401 RepID=UPI0010A52C59|nr:hypothetical protein [Tenacibaculum maritimum]QCD61652.1 hypothetical protein B9C57_03400 [Tenacibaculum maritimum]CAA0144205.1 Protein of unknown function precursor, putative sensor of anti-sigma and ECF sigma factor [Tenacibaculum maritimum]CAA0158409.1 Protein of unknown function precursor, putative sensor of anti-sigma and ECF sigma factor [Tenacibaculum maritimum]CAA0165800.1 Protein of unknown function precursor, putative sensor of anti-sigma and ECF sigma factor [Tenacibaculum maritim